MPYGDGPKSGCSRRVAVGVVAVRPLTKLMNAVELGSTGAVLMSWFHQLVRGNTWRPASDPVRAGGSAADTRVRLAVTIAAEARLVRRGTPAPVHLPCRR